VTLLPEDRATAKARGFRVAVLMHTPESDWASQQLSGMMGRFGECGVVVTHLPDRPASRWFRIRNVQPIMVQRQPDHEGEFFSPIRLLKQKKVGFVHPLRL